SRGPEVLAKTTPVTGPNAPRQGDGESRSLGAMAEGVGFEPTIRFPVYTLSKRAPSATRPSLRRVILLPGRGDFYKGKTSTRTTVCPPAAAGGATIPGWPATAYRFRKAIRRARGLG